MLKNQMKIQCDVCNKDEAAVFCSADEAALCDACDHRVHHANKLAEKHQRFSLLCPSPKQFPLCDVCQERRAFFFCQQDRAILCRDCDLPIHGANEHTQNHNRFLLTGVKLSATSALYSSPSSSSAAASLTNDGCEAVPNLKSQNSINKPIYVQPAISGTPYIGKTATATATAAAGEKGLGDNQLTNGGSGSSSSISEYLIEMLPGWRVEDFLDSSPASFGLCKTDDEVLPIWDTDLESNLSSFSSPKSIRICVPQAPPPPYPSQSPFSNVAFGGQIGFKEPKEAATDNKSGRKWRDDGCFTVPQISPPSNTASKRSRALR